jgi:hypothetical protein
VTWLYLWQQDEVQQQQLQAQQLLAVAEQVLAGSLLARHLRPILTTVQTNNSL